LDRKNLQIAQEFKQTTEGQVHSSELYVKDFVTQQTKRYNTLHNDIVTFVQQKDKVSSSICPTSFSTQRQQFCSLNGHE
jgi:hypothetical protein